MWAGNVQDGWLQTLCQNHPQLDHPQQDLNRKSLWLQCHVCPNIQISGQSRWPNFYLWFPQSWTLWTYWNSFEGLAYLHYWWAHPVSTQIWGSSQQKLAQIWGFQDQASCTVYHCFLCPEQQIWVNKHSELLNQWSQVMVLTFLMSFIAASAFFWFLQDRITLAPRPARSRAVALPIPVFPPETNSRFTESWDNFLTQRFCFVFY